MAWRLLATSRLVPWVMVMGRSVVERTVRQGTPRKVVSSWMPPELVSTRAAESDQGQEVQVAEWLDQPEAPGIQAKLLQAKACAWVGGENHRLARRQITLMQL